MYTIFLFTHSWLRWIVLILGIIVILQSLMGWLGNKTYTPGNRKLAASFLGTMHLQLILGCILYFFLSPIGIKAFQNLETSEVMKTEAIRYFAVEHISVMIIALIIAQVGFSMAKRAATDKKKFARSAIFFIIAMALILSRIPWNEARLFRGLG